METEKETGGKQNNTNRAKIEQQKQNKIVIKLAKLKAHIILS